VAERRAVVYISGKLQELPSGDTLAGASGGSITISDTPPSSPSPGDPWWDSTDGTLYIWYDDGTSAQWVVAVPVEVVDGTNANALRNRIVNPGMRVSQENGTSAGSTTGYYGADQFNYVASHDGTITFGQVASASPGGSTNRVRATVTGTDASIGAAQYALLQQGLEGLQMADALFGTADAKQLLLRFGWKAPAGTYCVALRNASTDRSYVREFTSTGSDQVVELTIPGDTSGTWPTTSSLWGNLTWALACGSDRQGAADSWNAANDAATSNQVNFIGTNAQVAELFDVGLYVDVANEGVFPNFELPAYDDDVRLCQRYFQQLPFSCFTGLCFGTTQLLVNSVYPVRMRGTPTVSLVTTAIANFHDGAGFLAAGTMSIGADFGNSAACALQIGGGTGLTSSRPVIGLNTSTFISANARA
jgi:hypothetical protein